MSPLRPRQENFCRRFVEYANAAVAARAAGYAPESARNHGYRLMKQPRIRARIAALQAELAREAADDSEVLIGKLENVYRRAIEDHHFYAATRAVEVQARLAARLRRAAADARDAGAGRQMTTDDDKG